jgi:hypothetical protein
MENKSDPIYEAMKELVDKYNEFLVKYFPEVISYGFPCEVRKTKKGRWVISEIDRPAAVYELGQFKNIVNRGFPNLIKDHFKNLEIQNKIRTISEKIDMFLTDDEKKFYNTYMSGNG